LLPAHGMRQLHKLLGVATSRDLRSCSHRPSSRSHVGVSAHQWLLLVRRSKRQPTTRRAWRRATEGKVRCVKLAGGWDWVALGRAAQAQALKRAGHGWAQLSGRTQTCHSPITQPCSSKGLFFLRSLMVKYYARREIVACLPPPQVSALSVKTACVV